MKKINSSYVHLGGVSDPDLKSINKITYQNNYSAAKSINNWDMSHVNIIKQVNWGFGDVAKKDPLSNSPKTEIQVQYGFKGQVIPNRLPAERVQDMKAVHFEIGNQAYKDKINTVNREVYKYQSRNNL